MNSNLPLVQVSETNVVGEHQVTINLSILQAVESCEQAFRTIKAKGAASQSINQYDFTAIDIHMYSNRF